MCVGVCICVHVSNIQTSKGQNTFPACFVACEMSHYVLLVVQHYTVISETTTLAAVPPPPPPPSPQVFCWGFFLLLLFVFNIQI